MNSGVIELSGIYEFIARNPAIPHRTKDRAIYRQYRAIIVNLIKTIPEEAGWYCWYGDDRDVIYIGQSSKGKTSSLHARLREELLEDYVAFWASVDPNATSKISQKYGGKYDANFKRAEKRRGTTRIAWVGNKDKEITQGILDVVEQKLIGTFKPRANVDCRNYSEVDVPQFSVVRGLLENMLFNPETAGCTGRV